MQEDEATFISMRRDIEYVLSEIRQKEIDHVVFKTEQEYFMRCSLGNITVIAITTLSEVKSMVTVVLVTILGSFINEIVFDLDGSCV